MGSNFRNYEEISLILLFILAFAFNSNAKDQININCDEQIIFYMTCFDIYHLYFTEFFGGINLGNVGTFNTLVAECQEQYEK